MGILFLQLRLDLLCSQFSCWGFEPESRKSRTISFFSSVCYKTLGYFPLSSYLSLWQQGHLFFFIDSNPGPAMTSNNTEYWVILSQRSQQQTLHLLDFYFVYFCRFFFSDTKIICGFEKCWTKILDGTFRIIFHEKREKSPVIRSSCEISFSAFNALCCFHVWCRGGTSPLFEPWAESEPLKLSLVELELL